MFCYVMLLKYNTMDHKPYTVAQYQCRKQLFI